jgi:CRP-like cAMP-binding protein
VFTLTYLQPGMWFSDVSLVDGPPCSHDATAHGETTVLCLGKSDFMHLLARHAELPNALLRLNCIRLRAMFERIEDLNKLPLAARLAKQLLLLARGNGTAHASGVHIGLHLVQVDLAQLLSASRQRVNLELKVLERQGILRLDPGRIRVLDDDRPSFVARAKSANLRMTSAKRLSRSKKTEPV